MVKTRLLHLVYFTEVCLEFSVETRLQCWYRVSVDFHTTLDHLWFSPKWNAIKRGWLLSLPFFPSHTVISPNATSWWFFYAGLVCDDWCRTPNLRSYFLGFSGMGFHSTLISACYVWAERWMFQYLLYLKTGSILKTTILHMEVSKAFSHARLFQTRIQWNNLECLI